MPIQREIEKLISRVAPCQGAGGQISMAVFGAPVDSVLKFLRETLKLNLQVPATETTGEEDARACEQIVRGGSILQTWVLCYYLFLDLRLVRINGCVWKAALGYVMNNDAGDTIASTLSALVRYKPDLSTAAMPAARRNEVWIYPLGFSHPTGRLLHVYAGDLDVRGVEALQCLQQAGHFLTSAFDDATSTPVYYNFRFNACAATVWNKALPLHLVSLLRALLDEADQVHNALDLALMRLQTIVEIAVRRIRAAGREQAVPAPCIDAQCLLLRSCWDFAKSCTNTTLAILIARSHMYKPSCS